MMSEVRGECFRVLGNGLVRGLPDPLLGQAFQACPAAHRRVMARDGLVVVGADCLDLRIDFALLGCQMRFEHLQFFDGALDFGLVSMRRESLPSRIVIN